MDVTLQQELATPYPITRDLVDTFREDGYIKLPAVLSATVIRHFKPLIDDIARRPPGAAAGPGGQGDVRPGFSPDHQPTCGSGTHVCVRCVWLPRLGQIAADLMQVQGVRMYHDQALCKEPGGGFTPWHADQHYWPLSNDNTVTAWIPLQDVPLAMGPLSFCRGSHRLMQHRNLSISDESERRIGRTLKDYPVDESPYRLGDVSFHRGWVFHLGRPQSHGPHAWGHDRHHDGRRHPGD